ncbi:Hypothetical predicted protein [Paramuricea clavata]|uniref:Uncharacterized protein n=1 Tax=Paramuricea clavata TaxID=317549 RepID=A0A6S7HB91_PARCT|nr:Hypothetical predicted protein [Paramuricea clavata]
MEDPLDSEVSFDIKEIESEDKCKPEITTVSEVMEGDTNAVVNVCGRITFRGEDGDAEGLPNTEKVECPVEGVSSLQHFSSCKKCQTKLIRNGEKQLVKCTECGLAQLFHKCQQRLIANVMFLKAENTISLLQFEDKLKQLYHIYTSQVPGGSTESFELLDDISIREFMLTVEVTVCYNTKKNVVSVHKKLTNKILVPLYR